MPPIDLTKREVAEVLTEFEESLPNQGVKLFRHNPSFNPRDINEINKEASRMLRFIGLDGYTALVSCSDLTSKKAAGITNIGSPSNHVLEISLDSKILGNPDLTYRILAHEICHNYLNIHDMFTKILPKLDEVRAELCPMYMGFGLIMLQGYDDNVGYLNLEDFTHAFCIVYKSRGMIDKEIINIVPKQAKQYATQILEAMNSLESAGLSNLIIKNQCNDYGFRRRIKLMQLVFGEWPEIVRFNLKKHIELDKFFQERQKHLEDGNHPILRNLLLETMALDAYQNHQVEICCNLIDELMEELCKLDGIDPDKLSGWLSDNLSSNVTCPECGFKTRKAIKDLKALKCPQCKHLFVWDGRPFNIPHLSTSEELQGNSKEKRPRFWNQLFKKDT